MLSSRINGRSQIKSFIILAAIRQSVQRVGGPHHGVIAPERHCSFRRIVTAMASRGQRYVRFNPPEV